MVQFNLNNGELLWQGPPIVSLLFGVLALDFGAVVMGGLFLYPHIIMYKEMKEGIMTEYNYHKIAHCCGNRNM